MDTQPIDATATALIDAFAQFQRSIITQAEALVAAWRATSPAWCTSAKAG